MTEPTIIYQDKDIIVVDKPSGLSVHADAHRTDPTLVDWLLERFPEIEGVGETEEQSEEDKEDRAPVRWGIVHRLDRETSGVMVVARSQQAFVNIKRQFARREVQKTYRAFVYGAIKEERGIIDRPIGRAQGSGSRRSVHNPHGTVREARTTFRTILTEGKGLDAVSYLEIFPQTGRTHQIRVHLASIQRPIICDRLYAPKQPCILGFDRLALHALSLSFKHPGTGKEVVFESPLPEEFTRAEKQLRA